MYKIKVKVRPQDPAGKVKFKFVTEEGYFFPRQGTCDQSVIRQQVEERYRNMITKSEKLAGYEVQIDMVITKLPFDFVLVEKTLEQK